MEQTYALQIKGRVQGIGFRPFVYRLAKDMGIKGEVSNDNEGVNIRLNATHTTLSLFIKRLKEEAPKMAEIKSIDYCFLDAIAYKDFFISKSNFTQGTTQVSPDIAICDACVEEYLHNSRRTNYPFINCTNCGPRYSIIKALPYDRPFTTMHNFKMCSACEKEYGNPLDRRFHAQPIACDDCGPHYSYHGPLNIINPITAIIEHLKNGEIISIKSLGGYNLICDASSQIAIARLREIKHRPRKPFAIMMADLDSIKEIAKVNEMEGISLQSWRRPIVLLKKRESFQDDILAKDYKTIGVMLPYMAIHYSIFRDSKIKSIVITSANKPGAAIIKDDIVAKEYLQDLRISYLSYNREIFNRIDDSVIQIVDGKEQILRHARGYVPEPLELLEKTDGIFATGADIISQCSIGVDNKIILSQYFGELENIATQDFYKETYSHLSKIFKFSPQIIVTDQHPGYISTQIGEKLAQSSSAKIFKMWHHHAHAVAVMAEYNLHLPTLSLVLDGTGLGPDGTIWGGELLLCNRTTFSRLSHFPSLPMPGGDKAAREPWRMAISLIKTLSPEKDRLPKNFIERIGAEKINMIQQMIRLNVNCPLSSGAGRLFDAIASLLGIADYNTYSAEAPILLEQATEDDYESFYPNCHSIPSLINQILNDISNSSSPHYLPTLFHNTLAHILFSEIMKYHSSISNHDIILAGGVMQNKHLLTGLKRNLENAGYKVFIPHHFPPNDASISIGQLLYGIEMRKTI